MPPSYSDVDRETIKRTVPKPSNKIHAVAVARLYVAYPSRQRWTYTGLQGAAVLANDLIGNTYWIKLVDISAANHGVIWDQEIYDPFFYNQDRTFFHSFELEDCLAGLSFVDEKEAKTFKKKMDEREKNAHKDTKNTPFQSGAGSPNVGLPQEKPRSRFVNLLHGRSSTTNTPAQPVQSIIPSREPPLTSVSTQKTGLAALDEVDPSWRDMLNDLLDMGITEDQIEENADFIKSYIEQRQAEGLDSSNGLNRDSKPKAPPPPPPSAPPTGHQSLSPQNTGTSRRGPPPAPPPSRRTKLDQPITTSPPRHNSPPKSPERTPSPPRPTFKVPPPLPDAGKLAHLNASTPPARNRASSNTQCQGPPPPPRPPKTPVEEENDVKPKFGVPPPFVAERSPPSIPARVPAPPSRAPVPAPPPRITSDAKHAVPPPQAAPPPLPPKVPSNSSSGAQLPPPPPPPPPHPLAQRNVPQPSPLGPAVAPPPPPARPVPPLGGLPPPPPSTGGGGPPPPPPPLPAGRPNNPSASPLPVPGAGKDALLASIRGTGGAAGGGLRKVKDSEKRDRSAAAVPGSENTKPLGSDSTVKPGVPSAGVGLADALASALSARNKKVSASDDEDDGDDWDDDLPKRRN